MCSIAGIFQLKGALRNGEYIHTMISLTQHRGPDGVGFFYDDRIVLGHARLSIIDPSNLGAQPMHDEHNRYVIVYNGELYNFKEIKKELQRLGHIFHSECDTEVILKSFIEWKEQCLQKFNGMFAFGIWDRYEKTLFLGRDRYGIKPLYYVRVGNQLYFASEIKSFLSIPGFAISLNKEALEEYLVFQNYLSSETLFKNVRMLTRGHYLTSKNGAIRISKYWDYEFAPDYNASEESWNTRIHQALEQGVQSQLVSDIPVGTYLSGGIDSSLISSIATQHIKNMPSFTCGFEGVLDERLLARETASHYRTNHREFLVTSNDLGALSRYVWHIEEPRMGFGYQNFLLAEFVAKYVHVVLAGTGGDELFSGYPWRHKAALTASSLEDFHNMYFEVWEKVFPASELIHILGESSRDAAGRLKEQFRSILNHTRPEKFKTKSEFYLAQSSYFELSIFLHGFLTVEDKLSMAHALETRVPYLDNPIVALALAMPPLLKVAPMQMLEGTSGKKPLRKIAQKVLPKNVTSAKKQGFVPPGEWLRGPQQATVHTYLETLKKREIINPAILDALLKDRSSPTPEVTRRIWSLLILEEWLRLFIDRQFQEHIPTPLSSITKKV